LFQGLLLVKYYDGSFTTFFRRQKDRETNQDTASLADLINGQACLTGTRALQKVGLSVMHVFLLSMLVR